MKHDQVIHTKKPSVVTLIIACPRCLHDMTAEHTEPKPIKPPFEMGFAFTCPQCDQSLCLTMRMRKRDA
jgi:hypothetical protein